jgi:hypothetical protein
MEIQKKSTLISKEEDGVDNLIWPQLFKAAIKDLKLIWGALGSINLSKIIMIKELFPLINKIISKIGKKYLLLIAMAQVIKEQEKSQ